MARIQEPKAYRVDIIESERGWGQKIEDRLYFDNEPEARKYAADYNEKYNPPLGYVPDWYMYAEYQGRVS